MKIKIYLVFFLFFTISSTAFTQTPVDVIEQTFKIGALGGEEVLYFGFAEGDQIIFNFEEVDGKKLKELEITEYPSSSKFLDYKTAKIENKTITVSSEAIYKFRFTSNALSARICKVKIQRIPASEATIKFNTSVLWKTVYDTSYTTEQERYLAKSELRPIAVVPTTSHFINGGSNATLLGGKSRVSLPVNLPNNTVEWYYEFSAYREPENIEKVKSSFQLVGQLTKIIDQTGALKFGVEQLSQPPGGNYCDVYLMDFNNKQLFEAKQEYRYFPVGSRENIVSGVVKVSGGGNYYLGLKNPATLHGIHVAIEVVAVTLNEEWGIRPIQKMAVKSSSVPFIKK
jgi:hypothetical protein